jgi:6-phosphogluconate dehydrogenase
MSELRIGFIGLGNLGSPLAENLQRHGVDLTVRDLDAGRVAAFVARGARAAGSPRELAAGVDLVITCLPSPAVCTEVMEGADGVLAGLSPGRIDRVRAIIGDGDDPADTSRFRRELVRAQRAKLEQLYRKGKISDEIRREIARTLDLQEPRHPLA